MNRRFSLDSLIAVVTLVFGVMSSGALILDFWLAPDMAAASSSSSQA